MRVPIELRRALKLINHGPTTLISSAAKGRMNVMAAAWVMALDFDPPKLAAVISSESLTRELVDASGELTVNLPTRSMVDVTYAVGNVSGRELDKLAAYGLKTAPASKVKAPLIEGCVAWLECRVIPERAIAEKYDLLLAEVVAAWADDEVFIGGEWRFPDDARRTIHHLSKGIFLCSGERVEARELPRPAKG